MVAFAVVLLLVAVVVIGLGLILYGNGVGDIPDDIGRDRAATKRGVKRISPKQLLSRTRTSVKEMTDSQASRDQRLAATGAFCVLCGLILIALAVLAFIAAAV